MAEAAHPDHPLHLVFNPDPASALPQPPPAAPQSIPRLLFGGAVGDMAAGGGGEQRRAEHGRRTAAKVDRWAMCCSSPRTPRK